MNMNTSSWTWRHEDIIMNMNTSSWTWRHLPEHEDIFLNMKTSSWTWRHLPEHEDIILNMNTSSWTWTHLPEHEDIILIASSWPPGLLPPYTKLFLEMISRLDAAFLPLPHSVATPQPFPAEAAMMSHQMNRPNANLREWRLHFSEADVSAVKVFAAVIWILKTV